MAHERLGRGREREAPGGPGLHAGPTGGDCPPAGYVALCPQPGTGLQFLLVALSGLRPSHAPRRLAVRGLTPRDSDPWLARAKDLASPFPRPMGLLPTQAS